VLKPLEPAEYRDLVAQALGEDIGGGDITTQATVPGDARAHGVFLPKADCVVAGLDVAFEAFRQLDPRIEVTTCRRDGERCPAGIEIGRVIGLAAALLGGERTALNFLQRLCGIATLTRRFVDRAAGRITILDTRKTAPALRAERIIGSACSMPC
jgi:nicotinate-nucleotide pyrophosphorylase (carboxylating)